MTTRRPRITQESTKSAPELNRPLNDALADLSSRLDAVAAVRLVVLQPVEIETGGAPPAAGTAPFPLRIGVGGVTLSGLLVAAVQNLTSPDTVISTAVWPEWRMLSDGIVEIRLLTGLAASTRYKLQLIGVV